MAAVDGGEAGQTPFDLPPGGVCLFAEFGGGGDQGVGQRVTAGELVRRVLPGVLMARFPVADDREGAAVFGGDGQRNHQLPVGILAHRRAEDVHHPPHEGHGAVAEKLPVAGVAIVEPVEHRHPAAADEVEHRTCGAAADLHAAVIYRVSEQQTVFDAEEKAGIFAHGPLRGLGFEHVEERQHMFEASGRQGQRVDLLNVDVEVVVVAPARRLVVLLPGALQRAGCLAGHGRRGEFVEGEPEETVERLIRQFQLRNLLPVTVPPGVCRLRVGFRKFGRAAVASQCGGEAPTARNFTEPHPAAGIVRAGLKPAAFEPFRRLEPALFEEIMQFLPHRVRLDGGDEFGRIGDGELIGGQIEFQSDVAGGGLDRDGTGGVLQLELFEFGGEPKGEGTAADPGAAPVAGTRTSGQGCAAVSPQQEVDFLDGFRGPGGDEVVVGNRLPEFFGKAMVPAPFQGGG